MLGIASAIIGGVGMVANSIMSSKESKRARKRAQEFEAKLANFEANRQEVINPFAEVTNPFNNLQVATGAAQMQAEETDISLANTLDTLRASGASAGGATALAQAAMRSKQGIANSIQEQEARNAQLRAEGRANQERLFGQGEMIKFNAQESREEMQLNRLAGQGQENRRLENEYRQQTMSGIAGIASAGMGLMSGIGASKQ